MLGTNNKPANTKYAEPYEEESVTEEEEESEEEYDDRPLAGIKDAAIRHGFIQKVYAILSVQLIITTAIAALFVKLGGHLMQTDPILVSALMWGSLIATIVLICCMACNPTMMRTPPINYIMLFVFTIFESILVGLICTQYTAESVLFVTAITAFVVFGLTLFACQTTFDFTGCGPYLFAALLVLIGGSFCMMFARLFIPADSPGFQLANQLLAVAGALIFSMYIVYDTQMIVGGKHRKHQFNVDDYCFAALNLYLDIINLFLYLLQLFGDRK